MSKNHVLKILANSEGEHYFVNTIMPICKDEVNCRLGDIYGWIWNEYEITDDDFYRCREFIMNMKVGSM